MRGYFKVLMAVTAYFFLSAQAFAAAEATFIGRYGDWRAYSFQEKGQKVCFMIATPQKQEGKFKKRGEVSFFVTRWPDTRSDTVNISSGYIFKKGRDASVTVDNQSFPIFTQGQKGWARDQAMDNAIVAALRRGTVMRVEGRSSRNTLTVDTYSLDNADAAYQSIVTACTQ